MPRILLVILSLLSLCAQAATQPIEQHPYNLQTDAGMLYGTLTRPLSEHPIPVVLLIAGSGPTDRNGNNPAAGHNDSLERLARELANHGIASVRYDKRGVAASQAATPDERDLSVERYVADAVAWSARLKADRRFDRLVLVGHSEGALIASLAARPAKADAVVSIAGSSRPIDQVLREQLHYRLPPPLLNESYRLLDSLLAGRVQEQVSDDLQVLLRPSVQPYLISLFRYDPSQVFAQLPMPALIIQGDHDIQVGIGDGEALKAAKPDAILAPIAGMNHVMRIVPLDIRQQLASYNDPNLPLARELTERIVDFILAIGTQPSSSGADNGR